LPLKAGKGYVQRNFIQTTSGDITMFISPAFAQVTGGGSSTLISFLPFILIFVVFYLLLIRPQQKRQKEHRALVENLKKGDIVITAGGITGKVTKAAEGSETVDVEIAPNVISSVIRQMITEVRDKDGRPIKFDPKAAAVPKK
jgi:preprotein translocase subunit YajC